MRGYDRWDRGRYYEHLLWWDIMTRGRYDGSFLPDVAHFHTTHPGYTFTPHWTAPAEDSPYDEEEEESKEAEEDEANAAAAAVRVDASTLDDSGTEFPDTETVDAADYVIWRKNQGLTWQTYGGGSGAGSV